MAGLKLSFIIEAIDRATAPVRKVGATVDRVTQPIRRVRASLNTLARQSGLPLLGSAVAQVGTRLRTLAGTAIGVAGTFTRVFGAVAVAGVGAFIPLKRTIDHFGTLNDHAATLGISAEKLQELTFAFSLDGGSMEDGANALLFMQHNAREAVKGNAELQKSFAELGIGEKFVKDNQNNPEVLFKAIADGMSRLGSSAEQINIGRLIFGRGGIKTLQTVARGAAEIERLGKEARKLGFIVSNETVAAMDAAGDDMATTGKVLGGTFAVIAAAAIPAITMITKKINEWALGNRELIATKATAFFEGMAQVLPQIFTSIGQIATAIAFVLGPLNALAQMLGGWDVVLIALGAAITTKLVVPILLLAKSLGVLGVVMAVTPIGWFIAGVTLIAGLAYLIYKNWEPISEFFSGIWESVKSSFGSAYDWIANKLSALSDLVSGAIVKLDAMLPNWLKTSTPFGRMVAGAATEVRARSAVPSALPAAGARDADVSGTIKVTIDQEGRARVGEMKSSNPNVDFDFYAGNLMASP